MIKILKLNIKFILRKAEALDTKINFKIMISQLYKDKI